MALSPIQIKGSKFYQDENQFFIKGIAYQLSPSDPLLDAQVCEENFALMAEAGTNVIRTSFSPYCTSLTNQDVDPWQDHTACMTILENYGIYLILDVDTFNTTIVQESPTWDYYQMRSYQHVIAAFAQFDNVLGFFAGNEIVNTPAGTLASPYIKASVRDAKEFILSQGYREIPVGYSAADIAEIRPAFQNYLVCQDGQTNDASSAIDFFGLNIYEWCGTSTYQESGYAARTLEMEDYPVPSFFSEFGCNAVQPRQFEDIPALYGPNMSQVWSGGIVYEWLEEANDYGLVNIDSAGSPTPLPDYSVVSSRWALVSPYSTPFDSYTPTNTAPSCPSSTGGFAVVSSALPPTPTDDGSADWAPVQELLGASVTKSAAAATATVSPAKTALASSTSPVSMSTSNFASEVIGSSTSSAKSSTSASDATAVGQALATTKASAQARTASTASTTTSSATTTSASSSASGPVYSFKLFLIVPIVAITNFWLC